MFGPSPLCAAATMASADFWPPFGRPLGLPSLSAVGQISQGKARDLRPIYPPHLRTLSPGGIGLRVLWPPRPPSVRLICGSCSSGRGFAFSFLRTPPRGDALAVRLGVATTCSPRGLPPPSHFPARFRSPVDQRLSWRWRAMPGAHHGRSRPFGRPPVQIPSARSYRTGLLPQVTTRSLRLG